MSQYNLGSVAFPEGHIAEEPHTSSTPKVSGVVRNPSPTTLPEFTTPQTWEWQGVSYDTIKEAANVATPNTIPRDVKEWTMNVVRAFIMRDVISFYEALHQKMDERHERTVASLEEEILARIHVEIMAVEIKEQLKVARTQIGTLSADNERLIKSNNSLTLEAQAICKDFEDYKDEVKGQMDALYSNMVALKEAQEKTTTYDKIQQANAHLEGGAALYMKEYAIKLTSGQDVGTWAEYTRKLEMAYKTLDLKCTAQSLLDAHCAICHKMMIAFAENFRAYAPESGYSDEDLIVKIREQRSTHIQTVMSVTETLDPSKIPTTWMDYLKFCLEIEIKHLQQVSGNKLTGQTMATKDKGKGKATKVRQVEEEGSSDTSPQIAALEQAIAALRGMSTTSTTPLSSKGKGKAKAHSAGTESTISTSTVKDTNARIIELDEFSEDFQYEV
ncbi:uncharacterized protein LAESUDRAFT_753695 [Laetiporus sulphureus 93-53]|uniref:Uncharacterized protein n=1 Tax=Laetiporus sulphureus 93-53 TaxID=1314785 RepID=A0A165I5Y0_9APHY|nr:uncharacterized protein LAESUDRAFT_753695 [Laetiporus sulphureus 93-53]KZT12635.1 hypothetical protein LAESUDRAFT_753695 [Laetiporus sulphureus 93-53]